jgi:hypothetical protein
MIDGHTPPPLLLTEKDQVSGLEELKALATGSAWIIILTVQELQLAVLTLLVSS